MDTPDCPLCDESEPSTLLDARGLPLQRQPVRLSRRRFLGRTVRTAAAAAATLALPFDPLALAEAQRAAPETLAKELFTRIGRQNRQLLKHICHPMDSPMLMEVHANWEVSRVRIGDLPPADRSLVVKILRQSVTREAYTRFRKQMRYDSEGVDNYSVGFFGSPGVGGFQFVIAGRHFTLRVDGAHEDLLAFGGPVLYGHAEERRAELNVWHPHRVQATEVFGSFTAEQRQAALVEGPAPDEFDLRIRRKGARQGIELGKLPDDQRKAIVKLMRDILGMYGERSLGEVDRIVKVNGGWSQMHLAFYRDFDMHEDRVWDMWRLEGPGFLFFFRGAPHVHTYIRIHEVRG